jgi:hypothetical protein
MRQERLPIRICDCGLPIRAARRVPVPGPAAVRVCRHAGSVYLCVLATALLVTLLGLGSLAAVRLQMRATTLARDAAQARACAASALELGLLLVENDPNWRTTRPNGTWLDNQPLGTGRFTLQGTDPVDGCLSDSADEPLVLTGIGARGTACHKVQVTLVPIIKPLRALDTCLCASGLLKTNAGKQLTALGAPVCTNGLLDNDGTIDGSAEGQSVDHTGTVTGTLTVPGTLRPMPAASVFPTYLGRATPVPYSSTMEDFVLGPGCNPFGSTDPNGLYVIDTNGRNLTLRNCRVYGTLVICAAGQTVTIEQAISLQNYQPDLPVLLVEGDVTLKFDSATTTLSEVARARNFNPIGAPYSGITDEDLIDEYPNEIGGLVHIKGSLRFQRTARIVGTVICEGTVTGEDTNTIVYDAGLYDHPAQGYTFIEGMMVTPGSWEQVVD